MTATVMFDPLVPWPVLAGIGALALAGIILALWRGLASFNDIDDPMRVAPGAELLIPTATEARRLAGVAHQVADRPRGTENLFKLPAGGLIDIFPDGNRSAGKQPVN